MGRVGRDDWGGDKYTFDRGGKGTLHTTNGIVSIKDN